MINITYQVGSALPANNEILFEQRDFVLVAAGFILGVLAIIGGLYYSGGPPALGPITGIFDKIGSTASNSRQATPTPQPGQPSNPAAGEQTLRVRLNCLSIHKCAGYECETIATLPLGARVTLLGQCNSSTGEEWCKIRSSNGEGWVSRYYLE